MDFDEALEKFLAKVGANMKAHYGERFPTLVWSDIPGDPGADNSPPFVYGGRKYLKIAIGHGYRMSVYCFVEVETGSILKAETWKKPSLIDRGASIYSPETYENADAYGSWLYIR